MSRLKIKHERDVDENDSSSSSSSSSSSLLLSLATTSDDSSNDENEDPLSARPCCLICSILPSLSSINSCQKHLTLIHLHDRNMRKRQKKLESESLLSSNTSTDSNECFFTPRPSKSSSSINNRNCSRRSSSEHDEIVLSLAHLSQTSESASIIETSSSSSSICSETNEFQFVTSFSPRIILDRIVHIKDEPVILDEINSNRTC